MSRLARAAALFALTIPFEVLLPAAGPSPISVTNADPISVVLSGRLEKMSSPAPAIDQERLTSDFLLRKFYQDRFFQPAWFSNGHAKPAVRELLNAIRQADREGLRPDDYHLKALAVVVGLDFSSTRFDDEEAAKLDLLLTDAFLTYGSDLVSGRTNPYDVDDDWFEGRRTGNLATALQKALDSSDLRGVLRDLLPTHPVYQRLRDALARYRQIERNGGWATIPAGKPLKKGDRDPRVVLLRQRLYGDGDLNQKPNTRDIFDPAVERGLKRFQARHGLETDGVLGGDTLAALNVPVAQRIDQIRINMERCRWLPDFLGKRHILVNVPAFMLVAFEDGSPVLKMKVVVGRKMRQTPVFSSTMTHVIFNPPWSVPPMVARLDIIDHIRQEPDYLSKFNFEVFDSYEENASLIDPSKVDWNAVTPQNLKFHFRQKSGPLNALGRIKFLLPNRFDVYLHDTPSRSLFAKTVRDFSSGCIRVENPVELAHYVLGGDSRWTREKIEAAINKNTEQVIALPVPIPVHLMYWTAWVDEQNSVQFRDDIYGRDTTLIQAINRGSSS